MSHITRLLLVCIFFQLHVSTLLIYVADSSSKNWHDCKAPDSFRCSNGTCILNKLKCDGRNDCDDNSDEQNCYKLKPINPPHVVCAKDEYKCANGNCIPSMKFCDKMIDCYDISDEYAGCVNDLKCDDRFRCNDKHCILKEWVCDGRPDCPDNSDELNCKNKIFTTSDCHNGNDRYLCGNQRCIPLNMTCDKKDNCGDGSDEGGQCTSINCTSVQCNQECKQTPQGPICTCREGYKLQDNRTCIDIDECQTYGICDQECVNTRGSYKCACKTGFSLHADKKTCEADDGEPTMIISTLSEIHTMYLKSKSYFISVGATRVGHANKIAIDQDYIYWSGSKYINNYGDEIRRVRINNEKDEVVIRAGIHQVSGLAVDWITHNIYFTDAFNKYIAVCNNDGIYCTKLIQLEDNFPKEIALLPTNGTMYWINWTTNELDDKHYIVMTGMDGKNMRNIISGNWCRSLTIDSPNSRLYWINKNKIESSYLDGTDRRIILDDIKGLVSLTVFENKLYWSEVPHNTKDILCQIQSCDKFSGKYCNILTKMNDNVCYSLYINHSAMRPRFQNPCFSKPCSELCLLNQNRNYTCACTRNKRLNTDNHTCLETKKKKYIIIVAGNTFINYYDEMLGNTKITVSNITKQITVVTCDSLTGTILASDQSTNQIIRYNPITSDIKKLFAIENKTLGGMAFDHIGNNLYLSNIQDNTIEVYSLTTMRKTIFYFDETPYDIALVPEEGKMFVVYKRRHIRCSIHEMKMNGIGATKVIQEFSIDTKISLHYNRDTRKLYVWNESDRTLSSYTFQDKTLKYLKRFGNNVSPAMTGEFLFCIECKNLLYINKKHDISQIDFSMPVTVQNPLLVPLYKIVIHEKYGCQNNNGNCSHVCLPASTTSFICACPPKMMLSANNRTCVLQTACPDDKIKCSEHDICIKKEQWCDGRKDCPNGEDEVSRCKETGKCANGQFMCKNGDCINWDFRCNFHNDCRDNSDEILCPHICLNDEYECNEICISNSLKCDGYNGYNDCSNKFDTYCSRRTCPPEQFQCYSGKCIPKEWKCDGEMDCSIGEDEANCMGLCRDDHFQCENARCISSSLKCNGIDDCGDNSDEKICLNRVDAHYGNCTKDEYHCFNTDTCLPKSVRCNGVKDCPKNDDEHRCAVCFGESTCENKQCVMWERECDQYNHCRNKSDKKNCNGNKWKNVNMSSAECKEYKCSNGICLPFIKVCNGVPDCKDGSDEGEKCSSSCASYNPCKYKCYKTPQGPICGCRNGYRLATDNISCVDINECEQDDVCSQICINIVGSFTCLCYDGYILRSDRISCKAIEAPLQIIAVTNDEIRKITSDLKSLEVIYPFSGLSVTSLDVNAMDDSVYWSSVVGNMGSINKLNVKTKELSMLEMKDVPNPGALAVDWVTNNIYISNNGHPNVIKVCNLELQKCATLVKIKGTARVLFLVLDPENRWLFWSQTTWEKEGKLSSKIYRTDMMGTGSKEIVSHIDLVSGMAIDYVKYKLYWSDNFRKTIESCNLDGTQRKTVLNTNKHRPLGINIYEDSLYWLIESSGLLQKCKLYGNKLCITMDIGAKNVLEQFAILHVSRYPPMDNFCRHLLCDYMCVLSANDETCICQDGKLPMIGSNTCTENTNISAKNSGASRNISQSGIYGTIISAILIIVLLVCAYYYYQRKKLKSRALSEQSICFHNRSYDRGNEISETLDSIILQSDVSPGQHEYINPMNDSLNNKRLKTMKKNTKMLGESSKQWRTEETEK